MSDRDIERARERIVRKQRWLIVTGILLTLALALFIALERPDPTLVLMIVLAAYVMTRVIDMLGETIP